MARKLRIAALCTSLVTACVLLVLGGAYYAARQVRPFYQQALGIEPEVLERGSRELESRATALYSDARQGGKWHALFTAEQINGWLATQLENQQSDAPSSIREPRVAISPEILTLGFQTFSGGVETVISVEASVFVTDEGAVAIRLMSVRAGALPLRKPDAALPALLLRFVRISRPWLSPAARSGSSGARRSSAR